MKTLMTTLLVIMTLTVIGCDCDDDDCVIAPEYIENDPPPVPQGVYSVTRDEAVLLYWLPIDDVNGDFSRYIVYRSDSHPDTGYWAIGETTGEYFVDDDVVNGYTYYYAVSSIDYDGNLSDLSYEYVFDTPRPQGTNRTVFDVYTLPQYSGWNFANELVVPDSSVYCDFFLEYVAGDDVFYFNVGNLMTDIQDMGFTYDLDEIDYSPEFGWSQNGWYEVVLGHTYVFWTADNHFAKIRVTAINDNNVIFDWAYQVDEGNPELKPKVPHTEDFLRYASGGNN